MKSVYLGGDNIGTLKVAITIAKLCFGFVIFYEATRSFEAYQVNLVENQLRLETLNKQLNGINSDLELFTQSAAHDLKAPLRVISSFVNILTKQIKKGTLTEEQLNEYGGYIQNGCNTMQSQINGLLEYNKTIYCENNAAVVNLKDIIDSIEQKLSIKIHEKNAVIQEFNCDAKIKTDPALFESILMNLADNGLKYNENEHPVVKIKYELDGNWHKILVSDNGLGIPKESLESVFKPFRRFHTTNNYEGSGLGLAICRKAAERLGGGLELANSGGNGMETIFNLKIPVQSL